MIATGEYSIGGGFLSQGENHKFPEFEIDLSWFDSPQTDPSIQAPRNEYIGVLFSCQAEDRNAGF